MEILIVILLLGLAAIIGLFFKFTKDEDKQQKNIEDAKGKKIADLETETARKDAELKKLMEERQRLEDEFFKAKDQVDIFKKENSELMLKLKAQEKSKEESAEARADLRQKDMLLHQETVARQKLQGELSLRESDIDKLTKELKTKTDVLDGLKGQYGELEAELIKVREGALKKQAPLDQKIEPEKESGTGVKMGPVVQPGPEVNPEVDPAAAAQTEPKAESVPKSESKGEPRPGPQEIPGFPKQTEDKVGINSSGVPSDMDFLKTESPQKKEEGPGILGIPEGAFKLTNVNKPAVPPEKDKDKGKSKREVLIDGFHPKPPHSEPHS